jgi:tRNA-specific 2-thiouridylase
MKYIVWFSWWIDSTFVARYLKKQWHKVLLVHLKITNEPNKCCQLETNLIKIAQKLNLPLKIIDITKEFKKFVIDQFAQSYKLWLTPNPCINCNQLVRFPILNKIREQLWFDKIATGHYAKIIKYKDLSDDLFRRLSDEKNKDWSDDYFKRISDDKLSSDHRLIKSSDSSLFLARPKDLKKDQTYMLYPIIWLKTSSWEPLLNYLEFPLWNYTKEEIKKIISSDLFKISSDLYFLQNYRESQNICFIPDDDYPRFLKQNYNIISKPWPIYDKNWNYLGEHKGIIYYTIWQRRNIFLHQEKIALNKKRYVIKIDYQNNSIILWEEKDLYKKEITIKDVGWLIGWLSEDNKDYRWWVRWLSDDKLSSDNLLNPVRLKLSNRVNQSSDESLSLSSDNSLYWKIRYHHPWEIIEKIEKIWEDKYKVIFKNPVRAPTPWQHLVIYYWNKKENDLVLGGGIIL